MIGAVQLVHTSGFTPGLGFTETETIHVKSTKDCVMFRVGKSECVSGKGPSRLHQGFETKETAIFVISIT